MDVKHVLRSLKAAGAGALAAVLLAGCGSETGAGAAADEGWKSLDAQRLTVSYPPGFTELSAADRGSHTAAAAALTEGEKTVGKVGVQINFTTATSAETAAIGAEASVQLGSTLGGQKKIGVRGTDDARRVDYEFTSTGQQNTPPKGTRMTGVDIVGMDKKDEAFLVRINAVKGKLSDGDISKIIDSVRVTG
ncbi:hypothetical protein IPZ58_29240 [Streptomyces roseoverticillatus]|uniref:hypothetical protein n=1 Tax=Streptomyces roseoverticillatus TaxID=66429 RepID=UPI001F16DB4E|nr:hypothetical protein [Streptomyces roseoverticillatus]MCF3105649.1 hypothetical protein [Streptomyces roseoverticillatus]